MSTAQSLVPLATMKKNHPDHGGSDWISARLNKAKETLLGWVFTKYFIF